MATSKQEKLGLATSKRADGPVECLGQTFANDEARRAHFTELLRQKLRDPAFRATAGFPKGTDEDILRMSDPPYYTACPNPFLGEFVRLNGRAHTDGDEYRREPFTVDTSVGKTDALYKAHSYHTKVPHLAIVPSILHYTQPGDLVLDGFCGSGMTGVAAQFCGTVSAEYRAEVEAAWKKDGRGKPNWGTRRAVLNDLGPAATFIAANYNLPFDVETFSQAAQRILDEVEAELGWMYHTVHVEPASSRLCQEAGFGLQGRLEACPTGDPQPQVVEPASSRRSPTVTDFTARRDNLPHWQSPGAFYFLTFNTHNRRALSCASRSSAPEFVTIGS